MELFGVGGVWWLACVLLLEGLRLGAAMFFEVLGGGYLPKEGDARASAGEPLPHYLVSTLSGHFSSTSGTLVSQRLVECREAWSRWRGCPSDALSLLVFAFVT